MTPVLTVSIVLQLIFLIVQDRLPGAFPLWISNLFFKVIAGGTIILTGATVSVIGLLLEWHIGWTAAGILTLAIAAPVAGLIENRCRSNGEDVFARRRFVGHLLTNALGGVAVTMYIWAAQSIPNLDGLDRAAGDDAAFNIALPLAAAVAIAFGRSEQERNSGGVDLHDADADAAESAVVGYSLRHVHQFLNTVFLATMIFAAGATMLYLFAQTIAGAKTGEPLSISLPVVASIVATLLLLLACGLPSSRSSRTVWMTFTTGTPAVMVIALAWLALFQNEPLRNVTALLVMCGAYAAYCAELILAERQNGSRIHPHYFSAMIVFFVLVAFLGAVYLS